MGVEGGVEWSTNVNSVFVGVDPLVEGVEITAFPLLLEDEVGVEAVELLGDSFAFLAASFSNFRCFLAISALCNDIGPAGDVSKRDAKGALAVMGGEKRVGDCSCDDKFCGTLLCLMHGCHK